MNIAQNWGKWMFVELVCSSAIAWCRQSPLWKWSGLAEQTTEGSPLTRLSTAQIGGVTSCSAFGPWLPFPKSRELEEAGRCLGGRGQLRNLFCIVSALLLHGTPWYYCNLSHFSIFCYKNSWGCPLPGSVYCLWRGEMWNCGNSLCL